MVGSITTYETHLLIQEFTNHRRLYNKFYPRFTPQNGHTSVCILKTKIFCNSTANSKIDIKLDMQMTRLISY